MPCITVNHGEIFFNIFSQGVLNYPQKAKKKPPREERTAVCLLSRGDGEEREFFMLQRPPTGTVQYAIFLNLP